MKSCNKRIFLDCNTVVTSLHPRLQILLVRFKSDKCFLFRLLKRYREIVNWKSHSKGYFSWKMLQKSKTGYLLSLAPFPKIELPKIEWGFCLAFFHQFPETGCNSIWRSLYFSLAYFCSSFFVFCYFLL